MFKTSEGTKAIRIGQRVRVEFEFEVDSIRKNVHKDGGLEFGGWIMERDEKKNRDVNIQLISIPEEVVKEILS